MAARTRQQLTPDASSTTRAMAAACLLLASAVLGAAWAAAPQWLETEPRRLVVMHFEGHRLGE
jgi:hypothetical protein